MKKFIPILIFLMFGLLINSCASNKVLSYPNEFEQSKKVWLEFMENTNNSYTYVVLNNVVEMNIRSETTITVSNGRIIQRDFLYTSPPENIGENEIAWTESDSELNTHRNSLAADLLTLNQVYQKAERDWLIERENATTYFESEIKGLMSKCGYVEDGCTDDCFVGIKILSIEPL